MKSYDDLVKGNCEGGWNMAYGHSALDQQILDWIINQVDPQATITSIRRLKGSTSSSLYQIQLHTGNGLQDVVLRKLDNLKWLQEEPDLALHEAAGLTYAERVDVITPQLLAYDAKGDICGVPLVLMSMLAGNVQLKPDNLQKWLDELAKTLANIHQLDGEGFNWNYYMYQDLTTFTVPSWTSIPNVWERIITYAKQSPPAYQACFIHRDYHPTNVLFNGEVVSGVVDWINACRGPAGVDVGHCRLDLALLYGVNVADQFLFAYQHHAPEVFVYDVYWDIISVIDFVFGPPTVYPGWEAFGVTGLTNEMMEQRMDAYVQSLAKRLFNSQ